MAGTGQHPKGDHNNGHHGGHGGHTGGDGATDGVGDGTVDTGSTDPTQGQQNVYDYFLGLLNQWGLGSLAPIVLDLVRHDYGSDTISTKLQATDEYKQRFAGNAARIKNGFAPLDPATYLNQEAAYAQALSDYGLPRGFYDDPTDFANWIGGNVSVNEVSARAQLASDAAVNADPNTKAALAEYYGIGDSELTAYFLDGERSLPIIEQQARAAQIGGAAANNGLHTDAQRAQELAAYGVTQDQARQGYAAIGQNLDTLKQLAGIDHTAFTQTDAENAYLAPQKDALDKVKKLASAERARFSGNSGIGSGSLAQRTKGSF